MFAAITSEVIEYFLAGAACAISLYCGVKMPSNKR